MHKTRKCCSRSALTLRFKLVMLYKALGNFLSNFARYFYVSIRHLVKRFIGSGDGSSAADALALVATQALDGQA